MAIKLAANLSFMFQEKPFLERFSAAAAAGKCNKHIGNSIKSNCLLTTTLQGFKAVEFGSHAPEEFSKEELVAAKNAAGVEVINISAPKGTVELTGRIC